MNVDSKTQEKSKLWIFPCKYNGNGISYPGFPLRVFKEKRITRYIPSCAEVMYILYIIQGYYRLNTTTLSDTYKYISYTLRPLWPSSGWIQYQRKKTTQYDTVQYKHWYGVSGGGGARTLKTFLRIKSSWSG